MKNNQNQLKINQTQLIKIPKEIVLLKDRLDNIFENFGLNLNSTGKKFLKNLAKYGKDIGYYNWFFKIDDKSVVKSVDFLKEVGTLYDLLTYLLGNAKKLLSSTEGQINLFKAIHILKILISSLKNDSTDQSEKQERKISGKQERFLNNAEALLKKRQEIISQFTKNNIISRGDKFFDVPKKIEKSTPKNQKNQFLSR